MRGFPPVNIFHCCWHEHSGFDVDDNDDYRDDDDDDVFHLLPMFAPVADATRQRGPVSVRVSVSISGLCSGSSTFFNFQLLI